MNVITAERLSKRYGRRVGVEGVDLDIPGGKIFGFLGPNGSGKTTTIRLLLGFLRPSRGRAAADETLQSLRSRARRAVTLIFVDAEAASRVDLSRAASEFAQTPK